MPLRSGDKVDTRELPTQVIILISPFLPIKSILQLSSTSKATRKSVNNDAVWAALVRRDFRDVKVEEVQAALKEVQEWRHVYSYLKTIDITVLVVGDGGIGKTSLVMTYALGEFPVDYIPTRFEQHTCQLSKGGFKIRLTLRDTLSTYTGMSEESIHQQYKGVNFALVCLNTAAAYSDYVTNKWVPDIKHYLPGVPFILVGTKIDIRWRVFDPVSYEQGVQQAMLLNAVKYMEVSSKTRSGVANLFSDVISYVIRTKMPERNSTKKAV